MPQIVAWKCPKTEKIFTLKQDYRDHLRAIASKRMAERRFRRFVDLALNDLWRCSSFEEIEEWLVENGSSLAIRAHLLDTFFKDTPSYPHFKFLSVKFDVVHVSHLSDIIQDGRRSHSRLRATRPMGGWKGKIIYRYSGDDGFSDLFDGTGICTGGGGGSPNFMAYAVTLYEDDWPNLTVMEAMKKVS